MRGLVVFDSGIDFWCWIFGAWLIWVLGILINGGDRSLDEIVGVVEIQGEEAAREFAVPEGEGREGRVGEVGGFDGAVFRS